MWSVVALILAVKYVGGDKALGYSAVGKDILLPSRLSRLVYVKVWRLDGVPRSLSSLLLLPSLPPP